MLTGSKTEGFLLQNHMNVFCLSYNEDLWQHLACANMWGPSVNKLTEFSIRIVMNVNVCQSPPSVVCRFTALMKSVFFL